MVTPAAQEGLAVTGFDPVYGASRCAGDPVGHRRSARRQLLAGEIIDGDTVLADLDP